MKRKEYFINLCIIIASLVAHTTSQYFVYEVLPINIVILRVLVAFVIGLIPFVVLLYWFLIPVNDRKHAFFIALIALLIVCLYGIIERSSFLAEAGIVYGNAILHHIDLFLMAFLTGLIMVYKKVKDSSSS